MKCLAPPWYYSDTASGLNSKYSKSARFRPGRSLRLVLCSCPVDEMSLPDAEPVRIETAGKTGLSGLVEEEALEGVLDLFPRGFHGEALRVAVDSSAQVDLLKSPRLDVEADCCHFRAGIREDDLVFAAADGTDLVGIDLHDRSGSHSAVDNLFLDSFHFVFSFILVVRRGGVCYTFLTAPPWVVEAACLCALVGC